MITWLAIKAGWASFLSWCRERWELLVGVVVGILGMLAITRRGSDARKVLEEKNKLVDLLLDSEAEASEKEREALRKNLEKFLSSNEEAEEEFQKKLEALDEEKRKRVKEILASESPEEDIASKLKEYLH